MYMSRDRSRIDYVLKGKVSGPGFSAVRFDRDLILGSATLQACAFVQPRVQSRHAGSKTVSETAVQAQLR